LIHGLSHGNNASQLNSFDQGDLEKLWNELIEYIDTLMARFKPKKILYLAVDGVSPLAKME
jgi:5'-3' exonuclease